MPVRIRRSDRARHQACVIRQRIGADVRLARHGAGLSIDEASSAVGMSPSVYGRIERGALPHVSVEQLCLACSAVGLQFAGRAYPAGPGLRAAGHGRLLDRFRRRLPPHAPWRTEVGIGIPGDLRAWDALTVLERVEIGIEAEMRLTDAQALDRRISLKRRDARISVVILLLPDTHTNRAALAAVRESLRSNYPLDTRPVLEAMGRGRPPKASGIVVI